MPLPMVGAVFCILFAHLGTCYNPPSFAILRHIQVVQDLCFIPLLRILNFSGLANLYQERLEYLVSNFVI